MFTDSFTYVLKKGEKVPSDEELTIWRDFLQGIVRQMISGYEKQKADVIRKQEKSFDNLSDDLENSDPL